MQSHIESTSDERAINNSTRQKYRVLTDSEKMNVDLVKGLGQQFIDLLHTIGGTEHGGERFGGRDLALANTHIEDAVMRAVRHITK